MRKTSDSGIELIREFEGVERRAYLDPVNILTVGVGHVVKPADNIKLGQTISDDRIDELLRADLVEAERGIETSVKVPLTDNQHAALVLWTFNLGVGNLRKSTLLRKLNAGDYDGAANEFGKWNKAGGKVLAGLTRRRKAERALFLTEDEPIQNGEATELALEAPPVETTKVITTTTVETPEATVEKKSIVETVAANSTVKTIAEAGVSKLGNRVATGLATGSATSVISGFFERNMGLIIFGCVLIVLAAAIVGVVLWHRSTQQKKVAEINSDRNRDDVKIK